MIKDNCPTFDVFRTEDLTVSKYIHEDQSETAIKLTKSIQSVLNPISKEIEVHSTNRNKYSVFISSSVGCYMQCKFCHLTQKQAKYSKLTSVEIVANLKEAIADAVHANPVLKTKYVKLSWMGMGDAINNPVIVATVTIEILDWIFEQGYACGLDGVDLSTVLPKLPTAKWTDVFPKLNVMLSHYPRNPIYTMDNVQCTNSQYTTRKLFRLFFSLGSAVQSNRNLVIPKAIPLSTASEQLIDYINNDNTVIIHHLLVQGLNDSDAELDALIKLMCSSFPNIELRILRYNTCVKGQYTESDQFLKQIRKLSDQLPFVKVQVSPGAEVSAAYGQFIVKQWTKGNTCYN